MLNIETESSLQEQFTDILKSYTHSVARSWNYSVVSCGESPCLNYRLSIHINVSSYRAYIFEIITGL